MKKYTRALLAIAVLLVLTSWAVYAHGTDDEVKDLWTEMREHHQTTHGDDFDTHHQDMHGDDWQEHVESHHDDSGTGNHMESGTDTMMDATMM